MKYLIINIIIVFSLFMCCSADNNKSINVIFLRHSTGGRIWKGNPNRVIYKLTKTGDVERRIKKYNRKHEVKINIEQMAFPKKEPYGWKNYPYDYYNIWIKHAGDKPYLEESTLEILTKKYNVIIFKHCYPVSNILDDLENPDVDSEIKTVSNYKLQYNELKKKMHSFPATKFIIWTPPPRVASKTNFDEAKRTREFYEWMINTWDEKNDNIFIWDYYKLATEGGLYLKPEYSAGINNSHPGRAFSGKASRLFANRIIQVVNNTADNKDAAGCD